MESLLKDLRYAVRGLLRTPAFSLPLVLTLALGLGANTAIFSVLSAVLLRPLPFPEPERLVRVYEMFPLASEEGGLARGSVSIPNLEDWRQQAKSFDGMAAYFGGSVNLQADGNPERLVSTTAEDALFALLQVRPLVGRALARGDGDPARSPVVVLSHALWQRRFAGDRGVVGRTLRLDGVAHTVVGVMPAGFTYPFGGTPVDVWMPLRPPSDLDADRGSHWLSVVARLRPGVDLESAAAEMRGIAGRLATQYPEEQEGRSAAVIPLQEVIVSDLRPKLLIVAAAAGLVLLIACANAAGLLLARSVARRRELGVRAAMGASGARLARQLLLEALVVAAAGAAAGLLLARPAVHAVVGLASGVLPGSVEPSFDYRVFFFVLVAAVATAAIAALAPILQLRRGLRDELQAGGARSGGDRGSRRLRSALVVSQVALSAVLLVGTGLLLKSLGSLLAVDPGIAVDRVVSLRLAVAGGFGDSELAAQRLGVYQRVLDRVEALPGVRAAGWVSHLPLRDWGWNGDFAIEGIADPANPAEMPFAERRAVSPGYFDALGVRVVRGRGFTAADDRREAPPVAMVNETLVKQYFRGLEPIGRGVELGDTFVPIVGVVADFRQRTLDAPPMAEIYLAAAQTPRVSMTLVVRSQLPTEAAVPMLRAAVADVAPDLPVFDVQTMQQVVESSLADRRLVMWLLAAFAGVALLLAATGLYGLLAYLVAQGRREIGIRMALGAARRAVLAMVVGHGSRLLLAGLAVGLLLALASARLLGDLLYGVRPADATTFVAVAIALTAVSLLALWVPARRALRVDPMTVLRDDV